MTNRGTTVEFHSSLSDLESSDEAVEQVIDDARDAIDGADVVFAFFTPHHRDQAAFIVEQLWLELDPQCAVGCVGEGVIGADREIERQPGLAILVGKMPGARLHPFHIAGKSHWHDVIEDPDALRDRIGIGEETRAVIGMGDPFSTPLDAFLPALDAAAPGIPLIGGMASGGRAPGVNVLVRNDEIFDEGFVGISLSGPLEVGTIVSQGSRPIGRPLVITRSHDNVIEQLGGRPAVEVLREIVTSLSESDQHLLQHGLLVGRAISEYRETFGRGDFLVRNIIGMDEQTGAIAMADYVRTGQTI
jgi:small ligand-binding sensory domain FIST